MKKYTVPVIFVALVIALIFFVSKSTPEKQADAIPSGADPANTTYLIEGERVLLTEGVFEASAAPDSSSTIRTIIFGQPVIGDLDGDGDQDMALVLQRDMGGSGLFYYLTVALQNPDTTAQGTNALFLGDRIAPQTIEIRDGMIIFNYAQRKPDEPMTAQPSVGVSFYAGIENSELVQRESL